MKRLIILLSLLIVIPGFVSSHVYILEQNPPPDAVLKAPPKKVRIVFVGSVEPVFSRIEVFDPNGKKVSKKSKCLEDDTIMEVALQENLSPGKYTVKWICVSLDGHKQTGEYTFICK